MSLAQQRQERRQKVADLFAKGMNTGQVAKVLRIGERTLVRFLWQHATFAHVSLEEIQKYGLHTAYDRRRERCIRYLATGARPLDAPIRPHKPIIEPMKPRRKINTACRYYVAKERRECGAPCKGNYCEKHIRATMPGGEETARRIDALLLSVPDDPHSARTKAAKIHWQKYRAEKATEKANLIETGRI